MMHRPCNNIDSSNNLLYDPSRVLEDYYNYSSPSVFQSYYPSLHHQYIHGDGDDNNSIEANFYQDLLLEDHHEIVQQHNPLEINIVINDNNNHSNKDDDDSKRVDFVKINSPTRKKISKKDRHTKIDTAQGLRDRRMRLSMDIAKKFFNLQDMLGFDKASQTVEWLLSKSFKSINELSRSLLRNHHQVGANSSSISWTSEVIVMDELSSSTNSNLKKGRTNTKKVNKKVARTIRPLAKESRDKARERARERTMEKMINLKKRRELEGTTNVVVSNGSSLVGDCSWIPFASYYHNLQENDGIIHELTIPELEHLSKNLGEANIWLP